MRAEMVPLLPDLGRFASSLTKNWEKSEDLLHDTVVRALSAEASFTPGTNLRAWLFTIMRNTWLNSKRPAANREIATDPFSLRFASIQAADGRDARDDLQTIERFLFQIKPSQLAPLMMNAIEGMEYEDIAAELCIPEGTVKSRIYRARQVIHEHLGAC